MRFLREIRHVICRDGINKVLEFCRDKHSDMFVPTFLHTLATGHERRHSHKPVSIVYVSFFMFCRMTKELTAKIRMLCSVILDKRTF